MSHRNSRRVTFQPDTHKSMQRGANLVVDAIRPTLGPLPRLVVNDTRMPGTFPEFLDNGGSIARKIINLPDRDADVGAMFVRDFLWRLQQQVGEGTATAAVLFQSIYNQSLRYLATGANVQQYQYYLGQAMNRVLEQLNEGTLHLKGKEKLAQIAGSVCYDHEMAELLGEIFDIIGDFGRIEIRSGKGRLMEREYVEGMYWERGLMAREPLHGTNEPRLEFENPVIILSDFEIEDPEILFPTLALALEAGERYLVIAAEKISDRAVGFLQANKNPERLQVAVVYTPGYGKEEQAWALSDLAVLTGGRPFVQAAGETFRSIKLEDLGRARRAWADRNNFGIVGGKGDARVLRKHLGQVRAAYDYCDDINRREKLRARIGKLMGGSATLWIGGSTEYNIKARLELAERTAKAVRAAMMDGVLPGGGAAFLACRAALEERARKTDDLDERVAYRVLSRALAEPLATIVENAGFDSRDVLAEIRIAAQGNAFDVQQGRVVDAVEAGLFDPARVVRLAFHTAATSAIHALSVDVMVHPRQQAIAQTPDPGGIKQI
jgi:chaperonin GroEL